MALPNDFQPTFVSTNEAGDEFDLGCTSVTEGRVVV